SSSWVAGELSSVNQGGISASWRASAYAYANTATAFARLSDAKPGFTGSVRIASAFATSSVSIPEASGPNITTGRSPAAIAARNFAAASRGPHTGFSNPRGRAVAANTKVASANASSIF